MASRTGNKTTQQPEAQQQPGNVVTTVEKQNTALASYDYGSDANAGFEGMNADHFSIPYLIVLQKGNPQVNEEKDTHIEGAKAGMFLNSVTGDLFDGKGKGVLFVPCHVVHQFVKFIPRSAGGGFVGALEPGDAEVRDALERFKKVPRGSEQKKPMTLDGKHEVVETFNIFGLLTTPDLQDSFPIVLPCSGAKRKPYKQWMTKARGIVIKQEDGRKITPPLFAHVWNVGTVFQEGNGNDWFSIQASLASRLAPDAPLFIEARGFRDLVVAGKVTATQPQQDGEVDDLAAEDTPTKKF